MCCGLRAPPRQLLPGQCAGNCCTSRLQWSPGPGAPVLGDDNDVLANGLFVVWILAVLERAPQLLIAALQVPHGLQKPVTLFFQWTRLALTGRHGEKQVICGVR